ncbi:MAG: hypothetical protein H7641_02700 [Candidatus Heimdallarchaeota archaeon]|nr:hypothetical protein [Candidatus Heimdallarchaeota archaeon]MCK4876473.1 hypothetical protein [Candidatus Heimdallarchaeota archaeon]
MTKIIESKKLVVSIIFIFLLITSPAYVNSNSENIIPCDAFTIVVKNNLGYVGSSCGIEILDISNPSNISHLSRISDPIYNNYKYIEIEGDYLYGSARDRYARDALLIFDICEGLNGFSPLSVISGFSNKTYFLTYDNDLIYISVNDEGFAIIDVTDKENPAILSRNIIEEENINAYDIAIKGNYAFLGGYSIGLKVFDISNKAQPIELYNYTTLPGLKDNLRISDIEIRGDTAFLSAIKDGLISLDISDISNVSITQKFNLSTDTRTQEIHIIDNFAFLETRNYFAFEYGFKIIDISNPIDYLEIANYTEHVYPIENMYIDLPNNVVYLAQRGKGITVVNITDINNPFVIEVCELPMFTVLPEKTRVNLTESLFALLGLHIILVWRFNRKKVRT